MPLRGNKDRREARQAELDRQDREHSGGSQDLGPDQPSCPRFSEVAADGRCPGCHATSFTAPGLAAPMAAGGYLIADAVGAVNGAATGTTSSDYIIVCVTCGKPFRRG